MDKYNMLLAAIKEFFNVNDELRNDLNSTCIESYDKSLDEVLEIWTRKEAAGPNYDDILSRLNDLNSDPHSISEMEEMYDFIDNLDYLFN